MMDAFKKALKDKQGDNFAIIVAKLDGDQLKELGVPEQAPMAADHKQMAQEGSDEEASESPEMESSEGPDDNEYAHDNMPKGGMGGIVKGEMMANNDQGGLAAKIKDLIKSKMKK